MTDTRPGSVLRRAALPVLGTGIAFAFLEAGAFTDLDSGTLQRMLAGPGLGAALLGAGLTAALLLPVLVWQERCRRTHRPHAPIARRPP